MGLAVSALSTRALPARILSNVSANWLGAVVSIACECDSCGRREPSLLSANHSRAPSVKRPGLPRASPAAVDTAILVRAELEVQLGPGDEEVLIVIVPRQEHINRRSAHRRKGADAAIVVIVLIDADPQTLQAEGDRTVAAEQVEVRGQGPLDTPADCPAGVVFRVGQTTRGVDQEAVEGDTSAQAHRAPPIRRVLELTGHEEPASKA